MRHEFVFKLDTGVAQLVEHWSPKPGVGRSSRSSRAKGIDYENDDDLYSGSLQGANTQGNLAFLERTAGQCNPCDGILTPHCCCCSPDGSCI